MTDSDYKCVICPNMADVGCANLCCKYHHDIGTCKKYRNNEECIL